ncbi:unnamed protein product [Spodoptera exigua]|nr:unnamed protein product [Spodoptera exigua]
MGLRRWTILFLLIFTEYFETKLTASAQGCSVGDGSSFAIEILDVHEGIIFNLETSGVIGFTVAYGQPIRDPPYFDMVIEDSRFLMTPNERFSQYEENEISSIIDIITTFRCSDGMNILRTFTIQLIDTNNHAPVFIPPPGHYHYVLDAPTPPGYHVTGCLSDLIARDVDLTTEKIIFEIEDNPFFSITYSAEMSIDGSKEFKAIVTTKTFVRNFPQEMTLHIKATDVHGTPGQGVQTTNGQITITGNKNFVLPDEPVFSKTMYTGIYTTDLPINQVVLDELISLQHGYDDLVRFYIDGPFKDNFKLVPLPDQVNQIRIEVVVPLEEDYLLQESIALEIIAEREFTSGTSATVILQLPRGNCIKSLNA